jgi:hypothetical protein
MTISYPEILFDYAMDKFIFGPVGFSYPEILFDYAMDRFIFGPADLLNP